jgi:glycosyltransferase involved in cell wall biosynthesis
LRKDYKIIACLPAFNEAQNIASIVKLAKRYVTEVIVCDDGSIDSTAQFARSAGASVIKHEENKGYGATIKSLFEAAKERNADIVVTIDSDGQHNAEQIPDLIRPILEENADIVIGSRYLDNRDSDKVPLYRTIGIKAITKLAHIISYNDITDAQSGFRAYGKKALHSIQLTEEGMSVSTEILVKAKDSGLRIREVPVTITYDVEDASTHNPLSHALSVITSIVKFISVRHPLAFYGVPGLAFMAAAAVFVGLTVDLYATKGVFSINMSILASGLGIFGLVLTATGVVLYVMSSLRKSNPAP